MLIHARMVTYSSRLIDSSHDHSICGLCRFHGGAVSIEVPRGDPGKGRQKPAGPLSCENRRLTLESKPRLSFNGRMLRGIQN